MEKLNSKTEALMCERFGKDNLIALASVYKGKPYVRAVNSYYMDGSFYVVTDARSSKMLHFTEDPSCAICGDWFTAQAAAENLGHVLLPEHEERMKTLREAFREWYALGHVNEADENTILLRLRLISGVLMDHGTKHEIDFT